ncbi:Tetratricopeptide repeat-containing protein [Cyclobacterium lianum]|uniref:Tetratricopeptide repeat-containing protein n=1 Tax=Cyclobacterium lianum TaxID=388280 RepID=A0A1M7LP85_9BACT|nr:tetratricopeptide repeat protein [Cyclobacterium lianum]SHM79463.1 Tetratricopeptide repeat-containing protein [Cyclobacterium lianum]
MNKDQLTSDFLPKEIVLKLYRDIPIWDYQQQIELVNSYAETIIESMDPDVYAVKLHNQIGFCYCQAGRYPQAIAHFKKVIEHLAPSHHPSLYFHVIGLVIRSNRQMKEFGEAIYWAEIGLYNLDNAKSSFERLNILAGYVDVLKEAYEPFNQAYERIITHVIADLGFPETPTDPIETVNALRTTNHIWNRKLSDLEVSLAHSKDDEQIISALENFRQHCPIEWYRKYAEKAIQIRKGN